MSKSGRTPKGSAVAVQVMLEFRDKEAVLEDMESGEQPSGGGSGGELAMPGDETKEVQGEAVRVGPAPAPPKPKRPRPPALQVPPLGPRRRLMPGAKPAAPTGAPRPLLIRATAIEAAARKLKFSPKRPAPQAKQARGPARAIQPPPPPPPLPSALPKQIPDSAVQAALAALKKWEKPKQDAVPPTPPEPPSPTS